MAITWKIINLTETNEVGNPDTFWFQKGEKILIARYSCSDEVSKIEGDIGIEPEKDFEDLTESEVLELVKIRISQNLDGSTSSNNVQNIEDKVVAMTLKQKEKKPLPW